MELTNKIKNVTTKILSKAWATLYEIHYDYKFKDGSWKKIVRESYDRGNGTAVLLYNAEKGTILLTKQLRMPIYINHPEEAWSIEACAGAIDSSRNAEQTIRKEIEEEVGYQINELTKIMELYMSPGALTEKMHLFVAPYSAKMRISDGGGLESEHEEIEVLELPFTQVLKMLNKGEIKDAKTIVLLQYAQIHQLLIK